MPKNFSQFYSNGWSKWNGTNTSNNNSGLGIASLTTAKPPFENVISGLIAADIKTDIAGESIKIVKTNQIVGHFELSKISTWDLVGVQIVVYSSDAQPVTLVFINLPEAENADQRLLTAQNGGILA